MFNGLFQPSHLLLILVVVLIVFGPGKLPEVGKAIGNAFRDMRNAVAGPDEGEGAKVDKKNGADVAAATTATTTSSTVGSKGVE